MKTIRFRRLAILGALAASIGCDVELTSVTPQTTPPNPPTPASNSPTIQASGNRVKAATPEATKLSSGFAGNAIFESPVRLKAGNEFVSVEAPGYACPTFADVDGDGKKDLVVGQFKNGNMQFCKNTALKGNPPQFASPQWLTTGGQRAEVPGVW